MPSLNWEKVNRERRVNYRPSPRSLPATQRQLDYIIGLVAQKGASRQRLPKTKQGASDRIEQLIAMPDKNAAPEPAPVRDNNSRHEILYELRQRFPSLTPMTVNSLLQLMEQVDPVGTLFFLDGLLQRDDPPEPLDELLPFILREFVQEFAPVT